MEITTPEKVCIVGTAPTSSELAPFADMSYEIWGLAWCKYVRCDRFFDLHGWGPHRDRIKDQQAYARYLAGLGKPVYLQQALPGAPNTITYPLDAICQKLRIHKYFASTIAYMIAYAIFLKPKRIDIYGVDLIADEEYAYQKPNTEFLLGLAQGMGIAIGIPDSSALLKSTYLYGYEMPDKEGLITEDVLTRRIATYHDMHMDAMRRAFTADGAKQEAEQLKRLLQHNKRGLVVNLDPRALPEKGGMGTIGSRGTGNEAEMKRVERTVSQQPQENLNVKPSGGEVHQEARSIQPWRDSGVRTAVGSEVGGRGDSSPASAGRSEKATPE